MPLRRRKLLAIAGTGIAGGFAGCQTTDDTSSSPGTATPTVQTPAEGETVPEDKLDEYEQVAFPDSWTYSRAVQGLRLEYAQLVSSQWQAKLGIESEVKTGELGNVFGKWGDGNYDIHWGGGWGGRPDRLDPDTFVNAFHSEFSLNSCGYEKPEYDEIVAQTRATMDREERQGYVYQAQEMLNEDVPVIFMFARNSLATTNEQNWSDYTQQVGGRPYTNVWNWQSITTSGGDSVGVMADTRYPITINPMGIEQSADALAIKFFYDRLIRLDADGNPVAWAASDWNAVDSKTVDVTLREGMTFHDGKPVRPADVKFTIEYMQEWEVPYIASFYEGIDSVELRDGNQIRFNLAEPNAAFVNVSLAQLVILPEHVWSGVTEEHNLDHPSQWADFDMTGSGPYEVVSLEDGDRIVYESYDDHHTDSNLDRMVWNSYGAKSVALGDVERGNASYLEFLSPPQYERANNSDGMTASRTPAHGWGAIYLNNRRRPLDDKAFRQALYHAVDRELILEIIFSGLADMIHASIPPALEFWNNPDLDPYDGGKQKAREMLFDAGYRWDQQGNLLMPKE